MAKSNQLEPCCTNFLKTLSPLPQPPVNCPTCKRGITFDRTQMDGARVTDEYADLEFVEEGYSPVNARYLEST